MIPPLVAFLATNTDRARFEQALARLEQFRGGELTGIGDAEVLGSLQHLPPPPTRPLVPTAAVELVAQLLERLEPIDLVPQLKSHPDAISVKAGLLQIHDCLDASHELAQQADDLGTNTTGSYWHAIMHRREPDYSNAGYWFRKVGRHPIFPVVGHEVSSLLAVPEFSERLQCDEVVDGRGHWDPMAFVRLCQSCGRDWDRRAEAAAKLQSIEMRVLLEYTCKAAEGKL